MNGTPEKPLKYIGIIDDLGIDQLCTLEEAQLSAMEMRTRLNGHRNARLWAGWLTLTDIEYLKTCSPEQAISYLHRANKLNNDATTVGFEELDF